MDNTLFYRSSNGNNGRFVIPNNNVNKNDPETRFRTSSDFDTNQNIDLMFDKMMNNNDTNNIPMLPATPRNHCNPEINPDNFKSEVDAWDEAQRISRELALSCTCIPKCVTILDRLWEYPWPPGSRYRNPHQME